MKLLKIHSGPYLQFFTPDFSTKFELPYREIGNVDLSSPDEKPLEDTVDLNKKLIKHPEKTIYARVKVIPLIDADIDTGDLLIIDQALEPKDGSLAVCFIDGDFTLRRLSLKKDGMHIMPPNAEFKPIRITEENHFLVWGIVDYIIKTPR